MGWLNLTMLATFRIIGGVTSIVAQHDPSETIIETSFICASVGMLALVGALSGIILRVNINMSDKSIITPNIAKIISLPTIAATALSAIAGTEIGNGRQHDLIQALLFFRLSVGIVTGVYLVIAGVTIYTAKNRQFVLESERLLLKMSLISLPFMTVRLIYGWLAMFLPMSSPFWLTADSTGSVLARAFMAVAVEMVVGSMFLYAGIRVDNKSALTRAQLFNPVGKMHNGIEVGHAKVMEVVHHRAERV